MIKYLKQLRAVIYPKAAYFWNGPENLPTSLKLEWKLIPIRWLGIVFVSSGLLLANLTPSQLLGAYTILLIAALYNIAVQMILQRRPEALEKGYLTTLADAVLTIIMLLTLGGFDSPYYHILYTVMMSTAMRYGYRPASLLLILLIGADFMEGQISGNEITAPFIIRSIFLVITTLLAGFLRDQAQTQAVLKERLTSQEERVRHERLTVLGEMASGVAHELRNPLTGIANASYYLNSVLEDSDENVKKHLALISKEVKESEKIINDLLDFTRINSLNLIRTSADDLIDEALKLVPIPAEVIIKSQILSDLPSVNVEKEQIKRVLINLLLNAIQAMPEGGELLISTNFEKSHVNISITDTGVGISPENLNKLFQPLFSTKPRGIGLGLAISQKFARANAGKIEVKSVVHEGSTFTLVLPVAN